MNQTNKLPDAMTDPPTCPVCGAPLARGQDGDLCPACLLGAAMGDDLPDQSDSFGACVAGEHGFPSIAERLGARIGRYKLLEQIGEGGFGVVWMAEQEEPVRRRVALKIIKPGMDTREVIARFEAERQALAMMEHPNIASVFDGGATETGRPYFVMELVKGMPITTYCDANQLSTSERLELFMEVCHAVQHAHQKGVIHRDLKPSNILVIVKDDHAVPKVIDFGVAKATQARLTEQTLFTRLNQWIGTPEYMSPEQAGLGSLDVDTRSDIYSLGVLLYELLTGRPPFDTHKLLAAGYDAVMRTIREEEPPKPSTRLGTLAAEELTAVAANRGAEPSKLNRLVRGDLDWIVMKALEKDRRHRYETANDLADDLRRHLGDEPVLARSPSAAYQIQKAWRRNKVWFSAAAVVVLALAVGIAMSTWQAVRATRAEAMARQRLAESEAIKLYEEVLPLCRTVLGPEHPDTLKAMGNLAFFYRQAGDVQKAAGIITEHAEFLRRAGNGPDGELQVQLHQQLTGLAEEQCKEPVEEDAINRYYAGNKESFRETSVHLYTITFQLEAAEEARADQRKEVAALRDEIANGKPIAEVAKERSEDPYAADGGDNLTVKRRDRTEPLDSAIFALKPGVPAIHDDGRFLRIMKVEDRVEGEVAPLAEVREDIAGILQQRKRDELLQQWQEEARVKVDAWEKENKDTGGPGRAAGEKEIPKTQGQE